MYFKNLSNLKLLISFNIFMTILMILVFVNIESNDGDIVIAINDRRSALFFCQTISFFIGLNSTASLFLPIKQIYLKDK